MKKYNLDKHFYTNDEEIVKQENIFKCSEEHVNIDVDIYLNKNRSQKRKF